MTSEGLVRVLKCFTQFNWWIVWRKNHQVKKNKIAPRLPPLRHQVQCNRNRGRLQEGWLHFGRGVEMLCQINESAESMDFFPAVQFNFSCNACEGGGQGRGGQRYVEEDYADQIPVIAAIVCVLWCAVG